MKRFLAAAIALVASAALILTAALIKPAEYTPDGQYRLGVGTVVSGAEGEAKATVTVVAVLCDSTGKIVDCAVDCGDFGISAEDVAAGKSGTYQTKNELGENYGMVAYAGAKYEWFEQAEHFAKTMVGKSAKDATYLSLASDGKAEDADLLSGCTIAIGDFKAALIKAMGDTLAATFKSDDTPALSLALSNKDSISSEEGSVSMTTDICAVASFEGKALAAVCDVAESKFVLAEDGSVSADLGKTKREKLDSYGMVAYAGAKFEWYEQADAFCDYIRGMTAEDIAAIEMTDAGKAADADLVSGCTIAVGDLIKIAEKAMKAAK